MYKRLIIIVTFLFLVGCAPQTNNQMTIEDYESLRDEIQVKYNELEELVN